MNVEMPRRSRRATRRATRKSGGGFFDFLFGSSEKKNETTIPNTTSMATNVANTANFVEAVVESPGTSTNAVAAATSTMLGGAVRRRKTGRSKAHKSRKSTSRKTKARMNRKSTSRKTKARKSRKVNRRY